MGKKGSWFSAIKRVFTHNSKDKPTERLDKKGNEEKKKGKGILGPGKSKSLIPLFREPSSIEKILGEADQLLIKPTSSTTNTTNTNTVVTNSAITSASSLALPVLPARTVSPIVLSPKAPSSPSPPPPPLKPLTSGVPSSSSSSSKASVPKAITENRKEIRNVPRVEPTLRDQHLSATKIQSAFRGYMGRRNFRALKGLMRLQEVVRGQNVKRQTANAMKQLQLMVKVQTQIQSRRIQMFEKQRQEYRNHYKELESTLGKWTNQSSENEDWDDSLLTKEEVDARVQKKVEAVVKRERAMAYAYSHKLWRDHPKSAHSPLDTRFNGFPRWWNWHTPPRAGPTSDRGQGPHILNSPISKNRESPTPRSSRSAAAIAGPTMARRPRTPAGTPFPMKDDDSLVSCPPFSLPSYMSPTVSALAKARASSNPRERFIGTPESSRSTGRRFSFPLTPTTVSGGGFGWGGVGPARDSGARSGMGKDELAHSVGEFSVGSAVSMPALVGRRPFNRFV